MKFAGYLSLVAVIATVPCSNAGESGRYNFDVTVETAERIEESLDVAAPSTTVIGADEIRASGAVHVADLLRRVVGVDITRSGTLGKLATARIDGQSAAQTLVLIDGVEINSPTLGLADLSDLTLDDVERIEVVRGPMSALYGSEAMGGVIHIITRKGGGEPRLSAEVDGGAFGSRRGAVGSMGSLGRADWSFQFSRTRSDGRLYDLPGEGRVDNDAYENTTLSGGLATSFGDSTLAVNARYLDASREIPIEVFGARDLDVNSTQGDTALALSARFRSGIGKAVQPFVHLGYTVAENDFNDPKDPDEDGPFASDFEATINTRRLELEAGVDVTAGSSRFIGGVGFERRRGKNRDNFGGLNFDDRVDTWSGFVQHRLASVSVLGKDDSLIVTSGVRLDDESGFDMAVNPRVSALWTAASGLRLRAGVGRGFRAPSLNELYFPFFGNAALAPERSWTGEFAVGRRGDRFDLEVRFFRTNAKDLITTDPDTFTAINLSRTRVDGATLELRARPAGDLWLRAGLTFQEAEDKDSGDALIRRPRRKGSISVSYEPSPIRLSVELLTVGEQRDVPVAGFSLDNPGWLRLDLAGAWRVPLGGRRLELFSRVENLLDRDYSEVTGFPAPGVNARAGVRFTL